MQNYLALLPGLDHTLSFSFLFIALRCPWRNFPVLARDTRSYGSFEVDFSLGTVTLLVPCRISYQIFA
jgi:hypothetical protein